MLYLRMLQKYFKKQPDSSSRLLLITVFLFVSSGNTIFAEENILSKVENFSNREEMIDFQRSLTLKELIVFGSQYVDKYGTSELYGFFELLGLKWGTVLSHELSAINPQLLLFPLFTFTFLLFT